MLSEAFQSGMRKLGLNLISLHLELGVLYETQQYIIQRKLIQQWSSYIEYIKFNVPLSFNDASTKNKGLDVQHDKKNWSIFRYWFVKI